MKAPVQFGNYYLLDRVATGGMAEVFRAKTLGIEGSERLVALKRLLPFISADKEIVSLFIDEAKLLIQLNQANICKVFDWGKAEDSYYLAMEFVAGCTAKQAFARCREEQPDGTPTMPLAQACLIVMKACEGLDYAHNRKDALGAELGVVHRDVSPSNLMISFEGEVKVIDFGLAKLERQLLQSNSATGTMQGKFGYMSPEQAQSLPLDRRSDIFSLGIVLYELLTGERLFAADDGMRSLNKIINAEILPPSTYNKRIPEELERVVLKALARDKSERYQTAMELHGELQQYMYTSGGFYSRKELSAWLKRVFKAEMETELSAQDAAREVKMVVPVSGSATEPLAKARQTMQIAALRGSGEATGALRMPKDPTGMIRVGAGRGDGKGDASNIWGVAPAAPASGKSTQAATAPSGKSGMPELPASVKAAGQRGAGSSSAVPRISPNSEDTNVDPPMLSGRVVEASWSGETRATETIPNRIYPSGGAPSAIDEGPTQGYVMQPPMTGGAVEEQDDVGDQATASHGPSNDLRALAAAAMPGKSGTAVPVGQPQASDPPIMIPLEAIEPISAPMQIPSLGPSTAPSKPATGSGRQVVAATPSGGPTAQAVPSGARRVERPPQLVLPPSLEVGESQATKRAPQGRGSLWLAIVLLLLAIGAGAAYWTLGRSGEVLISAEPGRELIVLVNQQPVEISDSPILLKLKPGQYAVTVQHAGYAPWSEVLAVQAGETTRRTAHLAPIVHKTGGFTLISEPAGASVLLDGSSLGNSTPMRVQSVVVGPHALEVRLGTRVWRAQILIEDGKTSELKVVLPAAEGTPTATAEPTKPIAPTANPTNPVASPEVKPTVPDPVAAPTGATSKAVKSPVKTPVRVAPVRRRRGTGDAAATIQPAAGNFGYLRLNSRPWTKIIVDGLDSGLNTPQVGYRLSPGSHQITLFNPQFGIRDTFTVNVRAGETQVVSKTYAK